MGSRASTKRVKQAPETLETLTGSLPQARAAGLVFVAASGAVLVLEIL